MNIMEQSNALLQVSEIQLVYKPVIKPSQRIKVSQASEVYKMLLDSWDMDCIDIVEQFRIVLLNRANKVLEVSIISTGGLSGTVVDLKLVFAIALKSGATGLIISHNHPSGNLKASPEDISITKKIKEAGKLFDIEIADHLIISSERYYSFSEERVM